MAEKFNFSSPYTYTYDDPIKNNDPDGKSGEVSIDNKNHTVTVSERFVFYGGAASSSLSGNIANRIAEQWNGANGTTVINGETYKVNFKINYVTVSEDEARDASAVDNNATDNYVRVEDGNHSSFMQVGGNAGWFNKNDDIGNSTTAAHESGHSLGLDHSPSDQRNNPNRPDIMTARGSLVDKKWGKEGTNNMNPYNRKVTQKNIDGLQLDKLNYNKDGKSQLGEVTHKIYDKNGN